MNSPDLPREAPEYAALTQDAFLGGKLALWQPKSGYRAGIDPVLLAASVEAKSGQSVLDLGCGVGTAALCLAVRVPGLRVSGLEIQQFYAALAARNGAENGVDFTVIEGDLARMPDPLKAQRFDHVIANPPYFEREKTTASKIASKEHATGEVTPLEEWVKQAAKRTAPGGTVTFIHRMARLPELLNAFSARLGSLDVLPISPRANKRPRMVLVRGRMGGRGEFQLCAPWVLHAGEAHDRDAESYTSSTIAVLRHAGALPFS